MVIDSNLHTDSKIWDALAHVSDPEIPVLSVLDLGVVRKVSVDHNTVFVDITPTYTGCPAMDTMAQDITKALQNIGYEVEIKLVLSPAWSTDWLSEEGKKKLLEYGIAPPLSQAMDKRALVHGDRVVTCPQCGSQKTKLINEFGSTACKALFQCEECLEPFDYFKCLK